jgi:hypothetical protein
MLILIQEFHIVSSLQAYAPTNKDMAKLPELVELLQLSN